MGKIKKILCNLPQTPGVYFLKDQYGRIIYIGKAVNLKSRVSSYFRNNPKEEKTVQIQASTSDIEIIEVFSEFEALLLEAKLINTHKPKYNVIWPESKIRLIGCLALFNRKEPPGRYYIFCGRYFLIAHKRHRIKKYALTGTSVYVFPAHTK